MTKTKTIYFDTDGHDAQTFWIYDDIDSVVAHWKKYGWRLIETSFSYPSSAEYYPLTKSELRALLKQTESSVSVCLEFRKSGIKK